jgi:hypothetical protein
MITRTEAVSKETAAMKISSKTVYVAVVMLLRVGHGERQFEHSLSSL